MRRYRPPRMIGFRTDREWRTAPVADRGQRDVAIWILRHWLTLREIGELVGVTIERVRQIEYSTGRGRRLGWTPWTSRYPEHINCPRPIPIPSTRRRSFRWP